MEVLGFGFLIVILIKALTELLRSYATLYLSSTISFQLGGMICRHLYSLPFNYFNKRHVGDIVSPFSSVKHLQDFICSGVVEIVMDGLMVGATLLLMLMYSLKLTLVAILAVLLYWLVRYISFDSLRQKNDELIQDNAIESTHFIESIKAIQSIKLFSRESERALSWQHHYTDVINSTIRLEKLEIVLKFANNLLSGAENILLVLLGGFTVINNELSIGMLIAFFSFKDQFNTRAFSLLNSLFEFKLLDVHLRRLADIVLHKPEVQDNKVLNKIGLESNVPLLSLKDIAFAYSKEGPLLFKSINLEVGASESIAIIGPSGCGKSSLLKIMSSLLRQTQGQHRFLGQDLNAFGIKNYRNKIATVLQDDTLFSGSIIDNITFFEQEPDYIYAQACARQAFISKEIEAMPMQYDTLVGNMGGALSGGQIQRILLARALYCKPRLLLLDEACSHLDINTEVQINKTLSRMNIARVIVAHRPQSIVYADKVYELTPSGLILLDKAQLNARISLNKPYSDNIAA